MKRRLMITVVLIFCMILFPRQIDAKSVQVSLPTFTVQLNGYIIDNKHEQYPLIVYKDITYFPMTFRHAQFMGLKANWYEEKSTLFVGNAGVSSSYLEPYTAPLANRKTYTASIVSNKVAVNTIDPSRYLNNETEEYPLLSFRDVTYFPLTWKFAVNEFGWEYRFNSTNGLVINTIGAFRPIIDDTKIAHRNLSSVRTFYCYSEDTYIGYPVSTFGANFDLIVRKKGEEEKVYSLESQLSDSDYYFNQMYDVNGFLDPYPIAEPIIEGSEFRIICGRMSADELSNVLLKIDVNNGQVISKEVIARKPV